MLVDLGRNDLGRVARAGTVTVSKYMEVERYSHVLHLVSHVEGRLKPDLDALDALRSVFPAGTLSGAPKIRAMQLIAAAEGERRGLYGGAVGYLGYDGNLDTAITIRSAVLKDGQAHVHTGAGIVAGSVPEKEFEETEHKAAALRRAIEMAAGVAETPRPDRLAEIEADEVDATRSRPAMILVIDNYDSFTFNLVQALQAAGRGGPRRAQRRDRRSRRSRRWPTIRPPSCAGSSSRPVRATRTMPGSRSGPSRSPPIAACRSWASVSGCSRWRSPSGRRSSARPTLVHGEASEVTHDGQGLLEGMPPAFMAARYHSLAVDVATLPPELRVTAMSEVRPGRHGHPPRRAAARGRPVPPRIRPDPAGAAPPRELPAPGR